MKAKEKPHYVSNKQFSQAVVEYCTDVQVLKENDQPVPVVPDYIASCFLKIAEGLSHKANFVRYTYREEMVMDAVENMDFKAIENYNIEAVHVVVTLTRLRTLLRSHGLHSCDESRKRRNNRTLNSSG